MKRSLKTKERAPLLHYSLLLLGIQTLLSLSPAARGVDDFPPEKKQLPDIETRQFPVGVIRKSESGRVYLFEDLEQAEPQVRKILLIRDGEQNMMAFRVLRLYPKESWFAAKRVRSSYGIDALRTDVTYTAIEKLHDIFPRPESDNEMELEEEDQMDLDQLEGDLDLTENDQDTALELEDEPDLELEEDLELAEEDDDFDRMDEPAAVVQTEPEPDPEVDIDIDDIAFDEVLPLDPDFHSLGFYPAVIRNLGVPSTGIQVFVGIGAKYAFYPFKMIFARSVDVQDSLALELGINYYRLTGYFDPRDSFQMVPISATARYNILIGEGFTLFLYGGYTRHFVANFQNASNRSLLLLSSGNLAAGAGLTFRIGPKWHVRGDLGLDMASAGLLLRF